MELRSTRNRVLLFSSTFSVISLDPCGSVDNRPVDPADGDDAVILLDLAERLLQFGPFSSFRANEHQVEQYADHDERGELEQRVHRGIPVRRG